MVITQPQPFVDHLNKIERPTWDDFLALAAQLNAGELVGFTLRRLFDRDAAMDFECSGGRFAIMGAEDSEERGTFGFCYLDRSRSDKSVRIGPYEHPEYCITSDVRVVVAIARTYFETGELDRSVDWHVARAGLGRKLALIPPSEILCANGPKGPLKDFLSGL